MDLRDTARKQVDVVEERQSLRTALRVDRAGVDDYSVLDDGDDRRESRERANESHYNEYRILGFREERFDVIPEYYPRHKELLTRSTEMKSQSRYGYSIVVL